MRLLRYWKPRTRVLHPLPHRQRDRQVASGLRSTAAFGGRMVARGTVHRVAACIEDNQAATRLERSRLRSTSRRLVNRATLLGCSAFGSPARRTQSTDSDGHQTETAE